MKVISDVTLDEERALFASRDLKLNNVTFEGAADGESALKESANIIAEDCRFALRYPLWHVTKASVTGCKLTPTCRAALWYSRDIHISNTELSGIKAVRECENISLSGCEIISPEFAWFTKGLHLESCSIDSEYFGLKSKEVSLKDCSFSGKYSFQYVKGGLIENCTLNTKDAFWHSKNITVKDCEVKGEYLGWYSKNLTFINCTVSGTQPLCYCRGLRLINCKTEGCDLSFEKSFAKGNLLNAPVSVKNFYGGKITVPTPCEIISDDPAAKGKVMVHENLFSTKKSFP